MKQFAGFEAKKMGGGREPLPVGGYVCEIKSAKEETYSWGSVLVLAIEVVEGEYAGFWKKDFDNNDRDDKKWRGTYRLNLPSDDGSVQDAWNKRSFGNFIWAVEESNPGYRWAWDEKTLKGKKLGVLYRNYEWAKDDRTGWSTEAAGAVSVEDCRAGKYRLPKDKPLKNKPIPAAAEIAEAAADEDDLPF